PEGGLARVAAPGENTAVPVSAVVPEDERPRPPEAGWRRDGIGSGRTAERARSGAVRRRQETRRSRALPEPKRQGMEVDGRCRGPALPRRVTFFMGERPARRGAFFMGDARLSLDIGNRRQLSFFSPRASAVFGYGDCRVSQCRKCETTPRRQGERHGTRRP
ncbi:hypothetical protein THAOC_27072, partial [Thalassiosira oceanica]